MPWKASHLDFEPPDMDTTHKGESTLQRLFPHLMKLADCPAFVAAVADDYWLVQNTAYLAIPDLAAGEDPHWHKLVGQVPEVARFDLPEPTDDASRYFRTVRRAAIRSICVAAGLGAQTLLPTSHFGGDASIKVSPAPRIICRVGRLSEASWAPSPTLIARALEFLTANGVIAAVEQVVFPVTGLATPEMREREYANWSATHALRHHIGQHRIPLIGVRELLPAIPGGYSSRYTNEDVAPAKVPMSIAAKITSPYAVAEVREARVRSTEHNLSAHELVGWALAQPDLA